MLFCQIRINQTQVMEIKNIQSTDEFKIFQNQMMSWKKIDETPKSPETKCKWKNNKANTRWKEVF